MIGGLPGRLDSRQSRTFERRARPLLGTLIEVGMCTGALPRSQVELAFAAAFGRIGEVEAGLSRFLATSEIGRFNDADAGTCVGIGADARTVLEAAQALCAASDGVFDISLGSGALGWRCDSAGLRKLDAGVVLDLGGIGKGHAVDCAVAALVAHDVEAGWVNAGGDLRAFGPIEVPVGLRDESGGGVRRFGMLVDGAFATSLLPRSGTAAAGDGGARREAACTHVSVAASRCIDADALTKIVASTGDARHPLLARYGAEAWLHGLPDGAARHAA